MFTIKFNNYVLRGVYIIQNVCDFQLANEETT